MEAQISYDEIIASQLVEWNTIINAKVKELEIKAKNSNPENNKKYCERIDELKIKQLFLQDQLDELKGTIDNVWLEMKMEIDLAWNTLRDIINKAIFEKN